MITDRTLANTAASTSLTAAANTGSLSEWIQYYRAAEIIVSEATNSDGSIRSMLSRGEVPATTLTESDIREMNDFDLANSIQVATRPTRVLDGPVDGVLDDGVSMTMLANFAIAEQMGRVAQEELEERYRAADQPRREALDSYFQQRSEATEAEAGDLFNQDRNGSSLNSFIQNAIREIGDVGNLFLGKPRKSSDSSFVSSERHEYDYCCSEPLRIFDAIAEGASGATYLDAALYVMNNLFNNADAGQPDADGMILELHRDSYNTFVGGGALSAEDLRQELNFEHNTGDTLAQSLDLFVPRFSYGNWVDAPLVRKLISRIRKLVRTVRSANVSEILELTTGQTQPEFMKTLLEKITVGNAIDAIRNFIVIDLDLDGVHRDLSSSGIDFIVNAVEASAGSGEGGGGATGSF